MDYILNEYHRNISNQELLNDIKSTAEKLNKKVLTQDEWSDPKKLDNILK